MVLDHINLLKSAHLMSTDVNCAIFLTSKDFLICQKVFILGTFKGMRINPRKNVHFSDKVVVGGSSPLISTTGASVWFKPNTFSFIKQVAKIYQ